MPNDTTPTIPLTKEILLTRGGVAIVDTEDYERVIGFRWSLTLSHKCYYARTNIKKPDGGRTSLCLHNIILPAPPGFQTDHENRDGLDCRKSNLRIVTLSQNLRNRGLSSLNTSGFRGVHKQGGRWVAGIRVDKIYHYLGSYGNPEEAAQAYDQAALALVGEFAQPNFPTKAKDEGE